MAKITRTFMQPLIADEEMKTPVVVLRPLAEICYALDGTSNLTYQNDSTTIEKRFEINPKGGIRSLVTLTVKSGIYGYRETEIRSDEATGEDQELLQRFIDFYGRDERWYKNHVCPDTMRTR